MGGGGSTRRRTSSSGSTSAPAESVGDSTDQLTDDDSSVEGDICIFSVQTTLSSPNRSVLRSVSVGDILIIELDGTSVNAVDPNGGIVGSITESWVGQLRECIDLGHEYEAEVLSIQGGQCKVLIRNQ